MTTLLPAKPFTTNLQLVRRVNGSTLDELAVAAAVNRSYLSRVERGIEVPTAAVTHRIAAALGVTTDELLAAPDAS